MTRSRLISAAVGIAATGVLAGLPQVTSGQSGDACTLTGSVMGTSGRDVICGRSGQDVMQGRGGNDELRGERGNDFLHGGDGKDLLLGGQNDDFLKGDFGDDGHFGSSGDDDIYMRDGDFDTVNCGSGLDRLDADLIDFAAAGAGVVFAIVGCEGVTVGAVREGPNVVISRRSRRVSRNGRTTVRLRCPASLRRRRPYRCDGSLRLKLTTKSKKGTAEARTRYALSPGQGRSVSLRLASRDRQTLIRRGRAAGQVVSVEKGHFGAKTTVQTVTLLATR